MGPHRRLGRLPSAGFVCRVTDQVVGTVHSQHHILLGSSTSTRARGGLQANTSCLTSTRRGAGTWPVLRHALTWARPSMTSAAGACAFTSHSGRRTMASRLLDQGHDLETLQLMLGHAELDHLDPYLQVSKEKLRWAFAEVL